MHTDKVESYEIKIKIMTSLRILAAMFKQLLKTESTLCRVVKLNDNNNLDVLCDDYTQDVTIQQDRSDEQLALDITCALNRICYMELYILMCQIKERTILGGNIIVNTYTTADTRIHSSVKLLKQLGIEPQRNKLEYLTVLTRSDYLNTFIDLDCLDFMFNQSGILSVHKLKHWNAYDIFLIALDVAEIASSVLSIEDGMMLKEIELGLFPPKSFLMYVDSYKKRTVITDFNLNLEEFNDKIRVHWRSSTSLLTNVICICHDEQLN